MTLRFNLFSFSKDNFRTNNKFCEKEFTNTHEMDTKNIQTQNNDLRITHSGVPPT